MLAGNLSFLAAGGRVLQGTCGRLLSPSTVLNCMCTRCEAVAFPLSHLAAISANLAQVKPAVLSFAEQMRRWPIKVDALNVSTAAAPAWPQRSVHC